MRMLSEVDKILIKLFAKSFFKANSGFLVCLFGLLISYCFFINTTGDVNLISRDELTFYHFIVVMTFISDPLMTMLVAIVWLIYSVKSWKYVFRQIDSPRNQFLRYSITSLTKARQVRTWLIVQSFINIPIILYWLFSAVFGVVFDHYLLPVMTAVFIVILTFTGALICVYYLNRLEDGYELSWMMHLLRRLKKTLYALFLYHLLDQQKMAVVFVKLLSCIIALFISNYFDDVAGNTKLATFFSLTIASSHTCIFYRQHQFEDEFLAFARNLPFSLSSRYSGLITYSILLILPEIVWPFTQFTFHNAMIAALLAIGISMLYRCILYYSHCSLRQYFQVIFSLYFMIFLLILFEHQVLVACGCLILSLVIFRLKYYTN